MSINVEEYIKRELSSKRPDLTFDPILLDSLDELSRKKAETSILISCSYGIESSYKYIPYIKYVNVEEILTPEKIQTLPISCQILVIKNLYLRTNNEQYLQSLSELAHQHPQAYKELLNLLAQSSNQIERQNLSSKINEIFQEKSNNPDYKFIYEQNNNVSIGNSSGIGINLH